VRDEIFRSTVRYSIQGLALIPIFHYAVTNPRCCLMRPLNWRIITKLGEWSYTIYLVHFVIIVALKSSGKLDKAPTEILLITVVGSILFAAIISRYVEKPLKPIRHRMQNSAQLVKM
jgi:peptidoglycan/LPS O-acetylase OafA/YrhL